MSLFKVGHPARWSVPGPLLAGFVVVWLVVQGLSGHMKVVAQGRPSNVPWRQVCDSGLPIRTELEYGALLKELQLFFAVLPADVTARECAFELARKVTERTATVEIPEEVQTPFHRDSGISFVAWAYSEYLNTSVSELERDQLRTRFRTALATATAGKPKLQDAVLDQFTISNAYLTSTFGSHPAIEAGDAIRRFRARTSYRDHANVVDFPSLHPNVEAALEWMDGRELAARIASALRDPKALGELWIGLVRRSDGVVRDAVLDEMLSSFIPPPTPAQVSTGALKTTPLTVHVTASLKPGNGETTSVDRRFGPVVTDFSTPTSWIDSEYGEVWSQSDLLVTAGDGGANSSVLIEGYLHELNVHSRVIGGYDPPWPGRAAPIRIKRDHTSMLSFTVTSELTVPACESNDFQCQPRATIIAFVSADSAVTGVSNSIKVTQSRDGKVVELAGTKDSFGRYRFQADRSLGSLLAVATLTRSATHPGASGWSEVAQKASLWTDALGTRRPADTDEIDDALRLWLSSLEMPIKGVSTRYLGRALAERPLRQPESSYSNSPEIDIYARMLLASVILRSVGPTLPAVDRTAIENALKLLTFNIRLSRLGVVRHKIEELIRYSQALDPTPLDLAIASLLLQASAPANALNEIATFVENFKTILSFDERQALLQIADSNNTLGVAEAILRISELKGQIRRTRLRMRAELVRLVVEAARLSGDCRSVKAQYSDYLGQTVSLPGTFRCE